MMMGLSGSGTCLTHTSIFMDNTIAGKQGGVNKKNERSFFFFLTQPPLEDMKQIMSDIYFFRHGQASFGEENYDRLSPIGVKQAGILARHLAKTGKVFDALYYGDMERQQKTAAEFIDHYRQNKRFVPAPIVSAAFNEYDSFAVWQALLPEVVEAEPSVSADLQKLPGDKKVFQKIFARVMNHWISGRYRACGIPNWEDFKQRVNRGITELIAHNGTKKRIAVFTSGGPISVAVQSTLGLSDPKTLEVSWQLLNASITRVKYNHRGMMLAVFNDVAHLELEGDEGLLTYR
jgi:broad specificity phosphatase PhoE